MNLGEPPLVSLEERPPAKTAAHAYTYAYLDYAGDAELHTERPDGWDDAKAIAANPAQPEKQVLFQVIGDTLWAQVSTTRDIVGTVTRWLELGEPPR